MDEDTKIGILMVQSLFPALRLTARLEANISDDRLRRITHKAWCRHCRRVIKHNKLGGMQMFVPDWYTDENSYGIVDKSSPYEELYKMVKNE